MPPSGVALAVAVALVCLAGAQAATSSNLQAGACQVAGYLYRPGQLPISSTSASVAALKTPAASRGSPRQLAAACDANEACVMFTTTGFLLSVEWAPEEDSEQSKRPSPEKWTAAEALKRLQTRAGITWAPKHCPRKTGSSCCGTYVAANTAQQLINTRGTIGAVLPSIPEGRRAIAALYADPSKCWVSDVADKSSPARKPAMPLKPRPMEYEGVFAPAGLEPTLDEASPTFELGFSSHVERLQVCKALAANPRVNPGCPGECRVGCCLPHLLRVGINDPNTSPADCSQVTAVARLAPASVTLGFHEQCRPSCLAKCGFPCQTDLRWDVLRSIKTAGSSRSKAKPASNQAYLDAMSRVVVTSMPATMPQPDSKLLGRADPSCAVKGFTHLPGVLPAVFGGPLEASLVGNHVTSLQALAKLCSSNPRCLFFTTTGRAVGLFQRLLGGLSVTDPVGEPFGMPGGSWSPTNSSGALVLPARRTTAAPMRLRYKRMPLCDTRCCGTYVADGAVKWQRVVAPPNKSYGTAEGAPPFPAVITAEEREWWVDVAARKVQCGALRRTGSQMRFPFCTPACKAACCDAGLPMTPPKCKDGAQSFNRRCMVVRQQAYEQCTSMCEVPCGFQQVSRCSSGTVCPSNSFAAARNVWRLSKGRGRRAAGAKRRYLD